ncbi:hypothetical protein ACVWWQ_000748 [Rhodanobacter sp. TND4EL1]
MSLIAGACCSSGEAVTLVGVRGTACFALLLRAYPNKDAEAVPDQGRVGMDGFYLLELFGRGESSGHRDQQ